MAKFLVEYENYIRKYILFFCFELPTGMIKLTDKKIRFICRHSVDVGDWTNEQLARQYDVSLRMIQQLVKEYKQTRKFPCLDLKRRPKGKPRTNVENEIIVLIFLHNSFKTQYIVLKF